MDISIKQVCHREACYLYSKTGCFIYKCPNQKAQIRAVLYTITDKKRQVWADKVRKLDESNIRDEQPTEKAPLKENFTKA